MRRLSYPSGRFFRSALFPLIAIVIAVYIFSQILVGCGGEGSAEKTGTIGGGFAGPDVNLYRTEGSPGVPCVVVVYKGTGVAVDCDWGN